MKVLARSICVFVLTVGSQVVTAEVSALHKIDFRNFTFPATQSEDGRFAGFTLKDGFVRIGKLQSISLESISYGSVDLDDVALVAVARNDGNATCHTLYVYHTKKGRPKLLESFEFGDGMNVHFGTAFTAHEELVIERYVQKSGDSECCPSVIEISYYRWKDGRFVLQGKPQEVPNGYVVRTKPR